MVVQQIRKLKPRLRQFLKRFHDCFPRKDTRAHLPVYVSGQLSDIPEKSVEPIAVNGGSDYAFISRGSFYGAPQKSDTNVAVGAHHPE